MADLKTITSATKLHFHQAKQKVLQWAAQRPAIALILVICGSVIVLPAVTIAALTPVAMIFTYSGILVAKGGFNVLYAILFQGFLIAVVIVALFVIGFIVAVIFSVLHSYRSYFRRLIPQKQKKLQ